MKTSIFGQVCVKSPTSMPLQIRQNRPWLSPQLSLSLAPDLVTTFIMMNSNGGAGPGVTWHHLARCRAAANSSAHRMPCATPPLILILQ